jgi:predicted O-methyltransferase YrrM
MAYSLWCSTVWVSESGAAQPFEIGAEHVGHRIGIGLDLLPATGRLGELFARRARDNGGGRVITCEFEPSKEARAREHLTAGGLVDLVEFREGDARQTLGVDLPDTIDLVLLDGAKALYPEILDLLESRLRPGAYVVADNADYCPEYLARVRSTTGGYLSTPFGEDVELSMRLPT